MAIAKAEDQTKMTNKTPILTGHAGAVLDLQFSPFHNNILATGGADATVKIWRFPEEGLKAESKDFKANLTGHYKKIVHLKWHPCSEFTLTSVSDDGKCKVWDV